MILYMIIYNTAYKTSPPSDRVAAMGAMKKQKCKENIIETETFFKHP